MEVFSVAEQSWCDPTHEITHHRPAGVLSMLCVCVWVGRCVCVFYSFRICYVCLMKPAPFWLLQDQVGQAPSIWQDFDVEIQGARAQAATDQPPPVCVCLLYVWRETHASTNTLTLCDTTGGSCLWLERIQRESIHVESIDEHVSETCCLSASIFSAVPALELLQ